MSNLTKRTIKNQILFAAIFALTIIAFYFLAVLPVKENANSVFGRWYWLIMGIILGLFVGYSVWAVTRAKNNKNCLAVNIADKMNKYGFLLKQLVKRNFKTKYKRSILGICWSVLSPLATMGIQYVVFSTIFEKSIPHYPLYLFCGTVVFHLFSECSSAGLTSITSNAGLIKKVYVPKYIYTLSKAISALINFSLTLIPLLIFALAMKVWPAPCTLLLLFDFFLLFLFCFGVSLILATLMVFFHDIKFLWGIAITALHYLTPIFYSAENITNEAFKIALKCNPLFHFLKVTRMLVGVEPGFTDGPVSPNLYSYLWCIIGAFGSLTIGYIVFKTQQEKFALYV